MLIRAIPRKVNAEQTRFLWFDGNAQQETLKAAEFPMALFAAACLANMGAVLAGSEVTICSAQRRSRQYSVQCIVQRSLFVRTERTHGADQSFERISGERSPSLARQSYVDAPFVDLGSLPYQVSPRFK